MTDSVAVKSISISDYCIWSIFNADADIMTHIPARRDFGSSHYLITHMQTCLAVKINTYVKIKIVWVLNPQCHNIFHKVLVEYINFK